MSTTTAPPAVPLPGESPPDPVPACAPVLTAVRTLAMARGGIEARLLEAARVVVAACGDELLCLKGFTSVAELTPAQCRKWRAEAKAVAADERISTLGLSRSEARDLVGLSLAGGQVPQLVITALEKGWATWAQVRAFWRRCHGLPIAQAELVALVLFGDRADVAHPDRLDPDGALAGTPCDHHGYNAALAAEATRIDGKDPAAERARRPRRPPRRHRARRLTRGMDVRHPHPTHDRHPTTRPGPRPPHPRAGPRHAGTPLRPGTASRPRARGRPDPAGRARHDVAHARRGGHAGLGQHGRSGPPRRHGPAPPEGPRTLDPPTPRRATLLSASSYENRQNGCPSGSSITRTPS